MKSLDELEMAVRRLAAAGTDAPIMISGSVGAFEPIADDDPRLDIAAVGLLPLWVGAWHVISLVDDAARRCDQPLLAELLAEVRVWASESSDAIQAGRWASTGNALAERLHVLSLAGRSMCDAAKPETQSPDAEAIGYRPAAAYLGISVATLRRVVVRGEIRTLRIGRRTMFRRTELQAFLRRQEKGGQ